MYTVVYYSNQRGDAPVREFLSELPPKVQLKVEGLIVLLEEMGPNLPRPYADVVEGKIRELRVRFGSDRVRILYYFFMKNYIVMVSAFRKKTKEIPRKEIELANSRMSDFLSRYSRGEITL